MKIKKIEKENQILVSNYSVMSTGINIKRLNNLIFASPLKSYTTITQGIGRGLRLHPDKKLFRVFDIVDDFEREYREFHGRVMTELAEQADCVERVVCGIPQRIK